MDLALLRTHIQQRLCTTPPMREIELAMRIVTNQRVLSSAPILLAIVALASCGGASPEDSGSEASGLTINTLSDSGSMSGTESGTSDSNDSDTNNSDSNNSDSNADGTDSNASDATTDDGPKFDLAGAADVPAGCDAGNDVEVDESFIWVPGTSDGTVAKIDTRTLVEVARYNIGPSGGTESASRTAVSGDGRFVVVNSRGTGRSTAVATNLADCVDRNMDGDITTSQNATDILAWDTDECVVWTTVHADWGGAATAGPRGITWTIGDWDEPSCSFINQKVWLGYLAAGGAAHLVRLDGTTGTLEEDLVVAGWVGSGYAPYGGALDPQDRPWFTGLRGELVRVNTDNDPIDVTRITQPANIQSYGMTVDPDGNPWMAGCSGPVSTYDVATESWVSIPDTSACHRGMAAFLNRALGLPLAPPSPFTDTAGTFNDDIDRLYAAGITVGCAPTRYCTNDPVTRGQMAAFLNRALGLPLAPPSPFTDTAGTFNDDIDRLYAAGITVGCAPTRYCTNDPVTRGQMAAFLNRALGLTPITPPPRPLPVAGNPSGTAPVPAGAGAVDTTAPDHVIGDGTPASCTSAGVVAAVAQGGVTFDCGPEPIVIEMTETAKVFNDTGPEVVIDGGGRVTLSGRGERRILYMNTCDPAQVWTTPHCQDQDHPRLTVQNLTFVDGNSSGAVPEGGGAIFVRGGRFRIVNSRFFSNRCDDTGPDVGGAAVRVLSQHAGLPVYVVNSTFGGGPNLGNVCSNGGGLSSIGVSFTVINSLFSHNDAVGWGPTRNDRERPAGAAAPPSTTTATRSR